MKRREWVKNITIIFLIVMLLLTFFSNTIMNYSLPEVATQYVTAGTITAKVRGTGIVTASDPYNVTIGESRVIASVAVKSGAEVEKGDILFLLEDSESTELQEAEKALDQLILAYQTALLTGEISSSVYNNVQGGAETSLATYLSQIELVNNNVSASEANVTAWQANVNNITSQISVSENIVTDTTAEEAALTTATADYNDAKNTQEAAKVLVDGYDQASISANQVGYQDALKALSNANAKVESEYADMKNAEKVLNEKKGAVTKNDAEITKLKNQLIEANANLVMAQANLVKAQTEKTDLVKNIQAEVTIGSQGEEIARQSELVAKLRSEAIGGEIVAPVSGIVTNINKVAGETTTVEEVLAIIQIADKGYTLEFSVTNEQAKIVSTGDVAELTNSWYYSEIFATLARIKADPDKPTTNKLLVFELTGDLTSGQSLSLSVGQKSADYELIVPNSAIREDNNGKFILIVETKSSPLGNRYIASRVDVEVLASDDTQSAISGGLYGYEYVITTSTKPVETGKQVRLAE